MTYRQPSSEGSDRPQPVVTAMSADQQMRAAAAKAAAIAVSGGNDGSYTRSQSTKSLARDLYSFIKGG